MSQFNKKAVWLSLAVFAAACGSSTKRIPSFNRTDASASSKSTNGNTVDGAAETNQYTMAGVYKCCNPGLGTACCVDAGTPRTCFQYGGIYGACRKQGEIYEGKATCATCCDGLARSEYLVVGNEVPPKQDGLPEGCDPAGPSSILICIACGDGVCGAGENRCNCPADCDVADVANEGG